MNGHIQKSAWIVQRLIGLVLVYSAMVKIDRPYDLLTTVFQYRFFGATSGTLFGALLPFFELTLGIALLCGICAFGAAALACAMFVIFVIGQSSAILRGIDADCGCFGAGEKVGWLSLLRTLGLTAGALLVLFQSVRSAQERVPPMRSSEGAQGFTGLGRAVASVSCGDSPVPPSNPQEYAS